MGESETTKLSGNSTVHRQAMDKNEPRLLSFDDQVPRLITLPARFWHAYDTLFDQVPYAQDYFARCYYKTLETSPAATFQFEIEIRKWLIAAIEVLWRVYNEELRKSVNDNTLFGPAQDN